MSDAQSNAVPAPVVAVAGWILPGLGYWLVGQRVRGLTVGVIILAMFAFGMLVGGMRVVDAPDSPGKILTKPWFIGQVLVGPLGVFCGHYAETYNYPVSQNHVHEIGTLYTAVAGMLNLMVILDSAYRANTAGMRTEEEDNQ